MKRKEQRKRRSLKQDSSSPKTMRFSSERVAIIISLFALLVAGATLVVHCLLWDLQAEHYEELRNQYSETYDLAQRAIALDDAQYEEFKRQYDELIEPHARHNEVYDKLCRLDEKIERAIVWLDYWRNSGDDTTGYEESLYQTEELRDLADKAWLDGILDEADLLISDAYNVINNIPPPPYSADIVVRSISVTAAVKIGETVTIEVIVTNSSAFSGIYEVVLILDDNIIESRTVTLTGNSEKTETFTIVAETTGVHTVEVDDIYAIFVVSRKAETPEVPSHLSWWIIGGIIGGCAVITASASIFILRRRMA